MNDVNVPGTGAARWTARVSRTALAVALMVGSAAGWAATVSYQYTGPSSGSTNTHLVEYTIDGPLEDGALLELFFGPRYILVDEGTLLAPTGWSPSAFVPAGIGSTEAVWGFFNFGGAVASGSPVMLSFEITWDGSGSVDPGAQTYQISDTNGAPSSTGLTRPLGSTPVPEPGALGLAAGALALMGVFSRRRHGIRTQAV